MRKSFGDHIPVTGRLDGGLLPNSHLFFMGAGIIPPGKKIRLAFSDVRISLGSTFGVCNIGPIILWADNVKLVGSD